MGEFIRLAAASVTFLVLARLLGPAGFGQYAGALALVYVAYPFANAGAGHLLVMRVSRDENAFTAAWSRAISTTVIGGVVFGSALVVLKPLLLPSVPTATFVILALSELIFAQAVELAAQAHQAREDMRAATFVRCAAAVARLIGAAYFAVVVDRPTVLGWVACSLVAAIVGATVALAAARWQVRWSPPSLRDVATGMPFAIGLSSWQVQEDIDKTMVLRAGFTADAGVYAAGYRIIGFAFLPIRSVVTASYPSYFREGQRSLRAAVDLSRRLFPAMMAFAVVIALIGITLLPRLTRVLGVGFGDAGLVIQVLAFLPALRVLQYLAGNAMTGAGFIKLRSSLQAATAGLNFALNLILIPRHSWRGAVIATYVAEVSFAVALSVALAVLLSRERGQTLDAQAVAA